MMIERNKGGTDRTTTQATSEQVQTRPVGDVQHSNNPAQTELKPTVLILMQSIYVLDPAFGAPYALQRCYRRLEIRGASLWCPQMTNYSLPSTSLACFGGVISATANVLFRT